MPKIRNPFGSAKRHPLDSAGTGSGYNDPQYAQIANSISQLLLGPESPRQTQEREAKAALIGAQTKHHTQSGRKAEAEADGVGIRNKAQNDDYFLATAKRDAGLSPDVDFNSLAPDVQADINRRVGGYRSQLSLTGDTNYDQFQKGRQTAGDILLGQEVMDGSRDAGAVSKGIKAREGKDLFDIKNDTRLDLSVGDMLTTDLGKSKIKTEGAQARNYEASASENYAQAQKHNADVRRDAEDPLITMQDPSINNGEEFKIRAGKAHGLAGVFQKGNKDPSQTKIPFNSGEVIDKEISAQLEGSIDLTPDEKTAIREEAARQFGAAGDLTSAVKLAREKLGFVPTEYPGRVFGTNTDYPARRGGTPGQILAPQGNDGEKLYKIFSDDDYHALPVGAKFVDPDGRTGTKR